MARALGIDDSVTVCDCCGKSGLKSTVTMELDDGEIVHYGSTCAARNTGKAPKVINSEIRQEAERVRAAIAAAERVHPACSAYQAKLQDAYRLNIRPGREFMEFVHVEATADQAARGEIARSFGR